MINGDKVFWQRRTDSLCAKAVITASSGHSERLNDFKLLDSTDLMGWAAPYDGVWTPEKGDADRSFTVTFAEESTVASVRLYGSPSEKDRVLNAKPDPSARKEQKFNLKERKLSRDSR